MANLDNVKAVFRITPARLRALMQAFPEDLLHRAPAEGEWSPIEVLRHLISADRLFTARTNAALAGQELVPPAEVDYTGISAIDLCDQFDALRQETLALLETLTDDHLTRELVHPRMGLVTLDNLLNYWGGHDLMHLIQIEQAVMQPFIPASGPWHVNFAKHVANPSEV